MNLFENRGCGTAPLYIVQGTLFSSGTLNQQDNIFLQTNTFIILAFSLHNIYFNTVIKLHIYKSSGGYGKLSLSLLRKFKKILVSGADPSHPIHANVNFMSKSHVHMQFTVVAHFLPLYEDMNPINRTNATLTIATKMSCENEIRGMTIKII